MYMKAITTNEKEAINLRNNGVHGWVWNKEREMRKVVIKIQYQK